MAIIKLYDLVLDVDKEIWSPNTLKARVALNVKGLNYETEWLTFFDIHSLIPEVTQNKHQPPTVPVIVDEKKDGEQTVVQDSWEIVKYLDSAYPDTPSLIRGETEGLQYYFYKQTHACILVPIFKLCLLTIHKKCSPEPIKEWFRKNRESMFKMTLEEFAGDSTDHITALKTGLISIHSTLQSYPYLTGDKIGFADVVLVSYFKMLAVLRDDIFESALLDAYPDDAIRKWWFKMEKYTHLSPPNDAHL
ncbi:hypothetical protein BC941DRAFT_438113 [Chlamydoabsidia padenii]|nr:hypothetical protein BC941DRAFT_438113 [Chlamydoabsidia padenii]